MAKIKNSFLLFFVVTFTLQIRGQVICAGSNYTLSCPNPLLLSNPVYSINPGGITNTTNVFVLSPSVTTTYTLYTTGQNSTNTTITTSVITVFTVYPQPSLAPSLTMATCVNPVSALDLNLTFNPLNGPSPTYTISWTPLPATVLSPQQTYAVGPFVPSPYSVVVSSPGNCKDTARFTILPEELNTNISAIVPSQTITCGTNPMAFEGQSTSPNVSYNWSIPGSSLSINTSSILVTANLSNPTQTLLGTFTLSVTGILTLCTSQSLITVYQNVFTPNPIISSGGNNTITCLNPTITLTNQSTSNIPSSTGYPTSQSVVGYRWFGPPPQGPLAVSDIYQAYTAGIYTMVAIDYNNSCLASATLAIYDACNLVNVLKNNLNTATFNLFPNPCNDEIQLAFELSNDSENIPFEYEIYSFNGDLITQKKIVIENNFLKINTRDLSNGLYSFRISNRQGYEYTRQFAVIK